MLAIRILWLQAALAAAQLLDLPELPIVGPLLGETNENVPTPVTEPAVDPVVVTPEEPAVPSVEIPVVTVPEPVPSVEVPAPEETVEEPVVVPEPTPEEPVVEPEPIPQEPITEPEPVVIVPGPTVEPAQPSIDIPTVVAPAPQQPQVDVPAPAAPIVPVQQPAPTAADPAVIAIPTLAPATPGTANGNNGGAGVAVFQPPTAAAANPSAAAVPTPVTRVVTAPGGNTFLSVFVPPTAAAAALQPSFAPDGTLVIPTGSPDSGTASDVFNTPTNDNTNSGSNPSGSNPPITQATVNSNEMSQGTKIGIGLGAAGGTVALVAGIVYLFWKRRMRAASLGHRLSDGSQLSGHVPVSEKQKMGWEAEHGNATNFDFGFEYREKEKERMDKDIEMGNRVELEGDSLPVHAGPSPPQTANPLSGMFGRR